MQFAQHRDGCYRIGTVHQDQVRSAYGAGLFQQVPDLAMGKWFPGCWELWQITSQPQGIEAAQVIKVQLYAVKDPALYHGIQRQPHKVGVVGLHLSMLGKVTDHGVPCLPAHDAVCSFVVMPSIEACVQQPHFLPGPITECLISWQLLLGR